MAGIYARVDVERGVHKAPANEVVRGMVTSNINATRRPLEFTFGKPEQDILNPCSVNVIRDFRKCDRTTMTQADIDAGRPICPIGVAPVKPAAFVIFRIQLNTATE